MQTSSSSNPAAGDPLLSHGVQTCKLAVPTPSALAPQLFREVLSHPYARGLAPGLDCFAFQPFCQCVRLNSVLAPRCACPYRTSNRDAPAYASSQVTARQDLSRQNGLEGEFQKHFKASLKRHRSFWTVMRGATTVASGKVFTTVPAAARILERSGRVAELADAKDLGSFGAILAGSTPVAPTRFAVT